MVAMCGALGGPFIYDDIPLIQGNSYVHGTDQWPRWFSGEFADTNMAPSLAKQARTFFRPIAVASYAIDWTWSGGRPWGFHLTNLLLHAANALGLFVLLQGWGVRERAALVGAVAFAVHPVQTETVAWISGRTDSLCLLGLLTATLGVRRFVKGPAQRLRRMIAGVLCLGGLALAFGAKEAAVVYPVLFGIELWSSQCRQLDGVQLRRLLAKVVPLVAPALLYTLAHQVWFDSQPGVATPSAMLRGPLVLEALGRYTALVILPMDLTMSRALLHYEGGAVTVAWGYVALGAASISSIVGVAVAQRRKAPAVSLGLVATLALAVPVSSIVWLGYDVLVSPRFLYIPMVGVAFAVAGAVDTWVRGAPRDGVNGPEERGRFLSRRAIGWMGALIATALFATSFLRSLDFSSEDAFWRRELESSPDSIAAQRYFVGRELREGRPRAAVALAQHFFSTSSLPDPMKAPLVLDTVSGLAMLLPDASEAPLRTLQHFVSELAEGRGGRLVLQNLELSLEIPGGSQLAAKLGDESRRLDMILAELAARLGDDARARHRVDRALAGCDDCWVSMARAARVLAQCGDVDRAHELAVNVVRLSPAPANDELLGDIAFARSLRAQLATAPSPVVTSQYYASLGAFGRAYRAAATAFQQPPDDPGALRGLAELAIRAGDVVQARRLLTRQFSPPEVEEHIAEVLRKVPWRDRVRPEDEWVPLGADRARLDRGTTMSSSTG